MAGWRDNPSLTFILPEPCYPGTASDKADTALAEWIFPSQRSAGVEFGKVSLGATSPAAAPLLALSPNLTYP